MPYDLGSIGPATLLAPAGHLDEALEVEEEETLGS